MVVENEDLPAWLVELRQQQFADQPEEPPSIVEDRREERVRSGVTEGPPTPMAQPEPQVVRPVQPEPEAPADVLDDLREQMLQAEEDFEYQEERTPAAIVQSIMQLQPTQRLLLSILLFLNVAVCGCMALIMVGRVELPF